MYFYLEAWIAHFYFIAFTLGWFIGTRQVLMHEKTLQYSVSAFLDNTGSLFYSLHAG